MKLLGWRKPVTQPVPLEGSASVKGQAVAVLLDIADDKDVDSWTRMRAAEAVLNQKETSR